MPRLPFLDRGLTHSPIRYLDDVRLQDVHHAGGAYVLLAEPSNSFAYPRRRSSVFYIGQALNLRGRLMTHARYAWEAYFNRRRTLYWPMYEYAAAFGCRYAYLRTRGVQTPPQLEESLLAMFAERYRSWPVANGAGGWGALRSLRQLRTQ